jgi:NAD(P)-dependent dehydrogenase (short-subunit alcohol dehydrogenase family)
MNRDDNKDYGTRAGRDGIRANRVAPGAIETDMNRRLKEDKEEMERTLHRIPIGQIGSPEGVAAAVEFLASDRASYVTGATFFVDSGMTLYPSFGAAKPRRPRACRVLSS